MLNDSKLLIQFGTSVKEMLNSSRIDQQDLAKKAGIDPTQLGRYLNKKTWPGLAIIGKIADALKVTPAYLLATPDERAKLDYKTPELNDEFEAIKKRLEALESKVPRAGRT